MKLGYAALAIILAVSPMALADWGAKGIHEPQTTHDRNDGYMWLDPDVSRGVTGPNKVYMATIQTTSNPSLTLADSANLATLDTRHQMTPTQYYVLLGVWRDCNNDGFIGDGDNGLFEYRTTLLDSTVGDSICPQQNVPWGPSWTTTAFEANEYGGLIHNDGTWVHEFIPIGYDNHAASNARGVNTNPFKVVDVNARVWVDNGLPGASVGGRCWIDPTPPGTFHTVGAIEDYADCFAGNLVQDNIGHATSLSPALASDYASLRAMDNPWGDQSQSSDVIAFDCSKPIVSESAPEVTKITVNQPIVPPHVSTSGTIGGTVNETAYDTTTCNRATDPNPSDTQQQVANLPYSHESPRVSDEQPGVRTENDHQFTFNQGTRAYGVPGAGTALGPGAMTDAGTNDVFNYGVWQSDDTCVTCEGYFTRQSVGDVTSPNAPANFAVQEVTAYAFVSSTAISQYGLWLPKASGPGVAPSSSTYGAEACGSALSGVINGWDCNGADWFKNVDGSSSRLKDTNDGNAAMGALPGDPYNMRVVSCYDEGVNVQTPAGPVGRDTQIPAPKPLDHPLDAQYVLGGSRCQ
jgi:hypothetical protein